MASPRIRMPDDKVILLAGYLTRSSDPSESSKYLDHV
jgi:hypothetical protein